jgi:hypothetical protein
VRTFFGRHDEEKSGRRRGGCGANEEKPRRLRIERKKTGFFQEGRIKKNEQK